VAGAVGAACEDGAPCSAAAQGSYVAGPAARPAPPRPATAAATPATPATAAGNDNERMKQLEASPGLTPPLAYGIAPPLAKHPSLQGRPGPTPAVGPADAPVKVFVFSDFQCPVCRRIVEPLKLAARTHPDDVQIIYLHNALEMHRNAADAAAAAIAALRQKRFWEFHDKLFGDQRALTRPDLLRVAKELGLDVARFERDMDAPEVREQVAYERSLAAAVGARGTPAFYVNGHKLVGWGSYGGFASMITRALKAAEAVPKTTPKAQVAEAATRAQGPDGVTFAELVWGAR
jgi:protein-disulfide isomerase